MTPFSNLRSSPALRHALPVWAAVTVAAAPLPTGVGGWPRVVNALVFLLLGPAVAVLPVLARLVDPSVAAVIAVAGSLTVLVLSSQLLLALGVWSPTGVAAVVGVTTVVLSLAPVRARLTYAATHSPAATGSSR